MRLVRVDRRRKLRRSDAPWFSADAPILRRTAVDALSDILRQHGELLPIDCPDAELWFYNCTRVVDALDVDASIVHRFDNGRIMRISKYAFHCDALAGIDIFKIPSLRVSPTFVSERVVERWTSAGLEGVDFSMVWHA